MTLYTPDEAPHGECDPCYICGETTIMCWCSRSEHCEDCGEYWCWCSCEREGIDVIGEDVLKI